MECDQIKFIFQQSALTTSMLMTSASLPDQMHAQSRASTATMHPENHSMGKHKQFQDLQKQNLMHGFFNLGKNAQWPYSQDRLNRKSCYKSIQIPQSGLWLKNKNYHLSTTCSIWKTC